MELSAALSFVGERHHGVLTTQKRDGRPQLSNIAYTLFDEGVIKVSVTADRAKTKNVGRDPRASLYVTSDDFRAYVVVECDAELLPAAADPGDAAVDALVDYYRAVAGEHEDWDDYRRAMVDDRRQLLLLHPARAYGMLPA